MVGEGTITIIKYSRLKSTWLMENNPGWRVVTT